MFYSLYRCYLFNRISINLDVVNDGRLGIELTKHFLEEGASVTLIATRSVFRSGLFEKIVVLGGFLILMIGICRLLPKYKEQKKTVMVVLLGLMGIIALISFGGLLLRLFGIL